MMLGMEMNSVKSMEECLTGADVDLITRSLKLAMKYHDGQVDKAGMPLIHHVIRVGLRAGLAGKSQEESIILLAIGVLHDILEDTTISQEELERVLDNDTVFVNVVYLTRLKGQTYFEYIDYLGDKDYASIVKYADILDHLEERGSYELPESLKKRYEKAKKHLLKRNPSLKELNL